MKTEIVFILAVAINEEVPPIYTAEDGKRYLLVEEGAYYRIIINNQSNWEIKVDIHTGSGQERRDFMIRPESVVEIASDAYARLFRFMPAKERSITVKLEFTVPEAPKVPDLVIHYLNADVPEEAESVKTMELKPGCIALRQITAFSVMPGPNDVN